MEHTYACLTQKKNKKYILCRSGFKFIRFVSKISITSNNILSYKNQQFKLNEQNQMIIQICVKDIVNETLTDILIKDFHIVEQQYYNEKYESEKHFKKFSKIYNNKIKSTYNIDFSNYHNLDIIDLIKLNSISFSNLNKSLIDNCPILDITKKKNIFKRLSSGLTKNTLKSNKLQCDKFYYAFLETQGHFIKKQNNEMVLTIKYINEAYKQANLVTILLIKFNKKNLKNYLNRKIIYELKK